MYLLSFYCSSLPVLSFGSKTRLINKIHYCCVDVVNSMIVAEFFVVTYTIPSTSVPPFLPFHVISSCLPLSSSAFLFLYSIQWSLPLVLSWLRSYVTHDFSLTLSRILIFSSLPGFIPMSSRKQGLNHLFSLFLFECNTTLDKDTVIYMEDPCGIRSIHSPSLSSCSCIISHHVSLACSFFFFHYSSCPLPFYSSSLNHTAFVSSTFITSFNMKYVAVQEDMLSLGSPGSLMGKKRVFSSSPLMLYQSNPFTGDRTWLIRCLFIFFFSWDVDSRSQITSRERHTFRPRESHCNTLSLLFALDASWVERLGLIQLSSFGIKQEEREKEKEEEVTF